MTAKILKQSRFGTQPAPDGPVTDRIVTYQTRVWAERRFGRTDLSTADKRNLIHVDVARHIAARYGDSVQLQRFATTGDIVEGTVEALDQLCDYKHSNGTGGELRTIRALLAYVLAAAGRP